MRSYESSEHGVDADLRLAVDGARKGRSDPLAEIMRQHNQRLFRIARSILRNDAEAEDIVQDAFVKAFTGLETLRDTKNIGAWLAKITVNLSISRVRQLKRREQTIPSNVRSDDANMEHLHQAIEGGQLTPERLAAMNDIRRFVEDEIDRLPDGFRETFVLRVIEQMSVEETAHTLDIRPETVKSRLHRAKAMLRTGLQEHLTAVSLTAFPFGGPRCERTTEAVLARLRGQSAGPATNSHH